LNPQNPTGTIGYFGIVMPADLQFQGFFLVDRPDLHTEAKLMMMTAMSVQPKAVIGALQAALIEGYCTGNQHLIAVAALALTSVTKDRFFIVQGERLETGTKSEMLLMESHTVEEAREELKRHPMVARIEKVTKRIEDNARE
jgi:hypothetical protein